ncbi:MAG TPA: glutathione S-transferase family protein [Hyphomonadaceae bacterium]|nr:glutathione S-transferase family protein [Hyphomonadaceae bacterium]
MSKIILSGGGEMWGLPEVSPFVTKTEIHLKMAGLDYTRRQAMPEESPKGQIPFIDDGGRLIGDSTFIRFHIEGEYGVDLDEGLTPFGRATALAIEMMVEHELGPAVGYFRWLKPDNFERGPGQWFNDMPDGVREDFKRDLQEQVRKNMAAKGIARHTEAEIVGLGVRSLKALEVFLAGKPFLMGDEPCGADAFVFATLAGAMTPYFPSPLRDQAIRFPTLVAYVSRMFDRFYPEFEWDAGITSEDTRQAA